jgi:hypothetical protein
MTSLGLLSSALCFRRNDGENREILNSLSGRQQLLTEQFRRYRGAEQKALQQ